LRESGPIVIGGVNIKSNIYLDYSTLTHLSREKYEESPDIMLKKGDVILVTRGNGIGDVGRFNGEYCEATINPSVVIISDFCGDSKFLYYFLVSPLGRDQVLSLEGGSSIPALYQGLLKTLELPFPEMSHQKAISDILSSLDDKIDLLHRQNKTLEAMAETLFQQWFIVDAKAYWEEKPLSGIANFLNGLACQKYPPKNALDKLPVLKIRELGSGISDSSDWASTDIKPEYIVETADVIFAWSASLIVKIWDGEKCILNQHLFKVTSADYPKWFYFMWCKHHLEEFIAISESHATTMGHIKRGDLDAAMVLVPKDDELQIMTIQMTALLNKQIAISKQIKTLEKLRDTLLPKLMNGEVRILNSKKLLETN
jgi:type I restriction enzyme S subunit